MEPTWCSDTQECRAGNTPREALRPESGVRGWSFSLSLRVSHPEAQLRCHPPLHFLLGPPSFLLCFLCLAPAPGEEAAPDSWQTGIGFDFMMVHSCFPFRGNCPFSLPSFHPSFLVFVLAGETESPRSPVQYIGSTRLHSQTPNMNFLCCLKLAVFQWESLYLLSI